MITKPYFSMGGPGPKAAGDEGASWPFFLHNVGDFILLWVDCGFGQVYFSVQLHFFSFVKFSVVCRILNFFSFGDYCRIF